MDGRDLQTALAALGLYKGAIDWAPDKPQNFGAVSWRAFQAALTGDVAPLSDGDLQIAAAFLQTKPENIGALADTESCGHGFDQATRLPLILFERHKFAGFTGGKFSKDHPDISNREPGGYPHDQAGRWDQLRRALQLDAEAALKSASWGMFQIMGFNWKAAGAADAWTFVLKAARSEADQLDQFAAFIASQPPILVALKGGYWSTLARLYNGPDFAKNAYDTKLAQHYAHRISERK